MSMKIIRSGFVAVVVVVDSAAIAVAVAVAVAVVVAVAVANVVVSSTFPSVCQDSIVIEQQQIPMQIAPPTC